MAHSTDPLPPHKEYSRRLESRRSDAARHDRSHRRLGNVRLLVAISAAVLAWLALAQGAISGWWLLAPVGVFIALAVVHDRVLRARKACERAAAYYERALARLDNRWMGAGETGDRFNDPAHPYANDLDLFGVGSLFELLSAARTSLGEEVLAGWLRAPSPSDTLRERQGAVAELRGMLDLREDLAVLGEDLRSGVHPEALAAWGERAPLLKSRLVRAAAVFLALAAIAGAVVWGVWGVRVPFFLVVLAEAGLMLLLRRHVARVIQDVEAAAHELELLSLVLVRLEREQFSSPRLAALRAALDTHGRPPSHRLARLRLLTDLIDSRDNVVVRAFGPFVLYSVHLAYAVETWRRESGPAVRRWTMAVGEMEALSSLAGYAYEHPADPFPEFESGGPCFEGEGLAHPFLAEERAVRNNVTLDGGVRVLVVSGSNMSGKSTLLRTVGVNAILAQAGAPVRAVRLRISPLQPAASIRVTDSLQAGSSRFYAEITRLRQIVDLTSGPLPVLFFLDEFLHGTNSHDRRIGAEAIVRGLVERGAIGFVTTHDLALAHIADVLAPRAANVHFEDSLENGKLHFDYRMRPGVVTKSNALELMRSVGLDV